MTDQQWAEASRKRLASALTESGALTSDWLSALAAAPRDEFIPAQAWAREDHGHGRHWPIDRDKEPEQWWAAVGEDSPITTQFADGASTDRADPEGIATSSNSMPTMVFSMLSALQVLDGQRVLEIGTGTGWNAALLGARLGPGRVVTIEYDPDVADQARARLDHLADSVEAVVGDGTDGWALGAPYDRLIATCSVETVPGAWIRQTRPGGLILAPIGPRFGGESIALLTVYQGGTAVGKFVQSSAFMRLRQQRGSGREPIEYLGGKDWPADGVIEKSPLSPKDVCDFDARFAIGAQLPGVALLIERYVSGAFTLWITDDTPGATSWATADWKDGATRYEVVQSGRRRLWDEVAAAWTWWDSEGRPPIDRFGLTASATGHRYWLDEPDGIVPCLTADVAGLVTPR